MLVGIAYIIVLSFNNFSIDNILNWSTLMLRWSYHYISQPRMSGAVPRTISVQFPGTIA